MTRKYLALDIESIGLRCYNGVIWILSLCRPKKKPTLDYDCHGKTAYFGKYREELVSLDVCKVVHNAEFDAPYIEMQTGVRIRNIWDTMLCETVIQGTQIPRGSKDERLKEQYSSALKYTLKRYGFPSPDKEVRKNFIDRPKGKPFTKDELHYAGGDTQYLIPLQEAQETLLKRDGGLEVALLENKVVEVVAQMKVNGLGVDVKMWDRIADKNLRLYHSLLSELPAVHDGKKINWNAPAQIKNYFYSRGIYIDSLTNLETIAAQANDKELDILLKARELYSDTTAYGKKWLRDDKGNLIVDGDSRIRTSWQQIINTGRFATSNPNILALPKEGSQRGAIAPRAGHIFVIGDYSGQEIGIMAAAAKEDLWIEALLRGDDVHSLTASLIFPNEWRAGKEKRCTFPGKCECKEHNRVRQYAKIINFMLAYGGGPKKFAQMTRTDAYTAIKIVNRHKTVIRKLTRYLENNGKISLRTGVAYSADPYKRRMVLQGAEDWQIVNQGKNFPIQGSGANMLKLAMISMPEQYPIVLPFHDELVLEVKIKDGERARKAMKTIMEQSANYITGIAGIIKVEPRLAKNFLKPK